MSKPGFPIWWDSTITIYNKYTDPNTQVVEWYRSVVTDSFWKLEGSKVTVGEVVIDSKAITCRIPKDSRYLQKKVWSDLPAIDKPDHFTLGQGDILVKGSIEDVINEYQAGHRSTDLLAKYREYQQCMEIDDCSDNTGVGRNNEHYFVRGK